MSSFDLPAPDVFTAGTVGEPGARVFYFQVRDDELVLSLRCEKQQVAALAEYLDGLLEDLEPSPYGPVVADLVFREPPQELWTVGPIGVAYDGTADRIVVELTQLTDDPDEEEDGATVRIRLTRAQVAAFVPHARTLVEAGRPPCLFCGRPVDPDGHVCPRMN